MAYCAVGCLGKDVGLGAAALATGQVYVDAIGRDPLRISQANLKLVADSLEATAEKTSKLGLITKVGLMLAVAALFKVAAVGLPALIALKHFCIASACLTKPALLINGFLEVGKEVVTGVARDIVTDAVEFGLAALTVHASHKHLQARAKKPFASRTRQRTGQVLIG